MSKLVTDQPTRPGADDTDDAPASPEEIAIIKERLAQPEGPTRPWSEFYAELKDKRPLPR
jgi:hypothetical protein